MAIKTDEINRGGERGRQPISFRSCVEDSEHTDQKAAQVPSAPPGPLADVKTKLKEVDRNRAGWSYSDASGSFAGRREQVGRLQEDRGKAVIAKTIAEATKAVEKASAEAQSFSAEVREGSDGTLSSRVNSPIEQFEKSSEAILSTSHRGRESEHVARHHAKRE